MLCGLLPCPVQRAAVQGSSTQGGTNPMAQGNATLQYKSYCTNQLTRIPALWGSVLCLCSAGTYPMMRVSGGCKWPSSY